MGQQPRRSQVAQRIMKPSRNVCQVVPNVIMAATMLALAMLSIGAAAGDDVAEIDPRAYTDAQFSSESIARLIKEMDSDDGGRRGRAIWKLGQLGPEARAAVPKLIQLLSDDGISERFMEFQLFVRERTGYTLADFGAEAVDPLSSEFEKGATGAARPKC